MEKELKIMKTTKVFPSKIFLYTVYEQAEQLKMVKSVKLAKHKAKQLATQVVHAIVQNGVIVIYMCGNNVGDM